MRAIFTGSISEGFWLDRVVSADTTEKEIALARAIADQLTQNHQFAEVIEVHHPTVLNPHFVTTDGAVCVAFSDGSASLAGGVSLIGPFENVNAAEAFASEEAHGDDYEIFTPNGAPLQPYRVSYFEDVGDKTRLYFFCLAENGDHAESQCEDAFPGVQIDTVTETDVDDMIFAGKPTPTLPTNRHGRPS